MAVGFASAVKAKVKAKRPKGLQRTARQLLRIFARVWLIAFVLEAAHLPTFAQSVSISADFGDRDATSVVIPRGIFGFNPVAMQDPAKLRTVAEAGFSEARRTPDLPTIYATRTPDWSGFDWSMQQVQKAGLHPLLAISRTPPWLQPSSSPCAKGIDPSHAVPIDRNEWASLAASFVAHLDKKFPGLVQDYEIWNEPDLQTSLCLLDGTDIGRRQAYLDLYAAAAAAMRAQADQDGVTIRIGGPAVSDATLAPLWIAALISDTRTAPYVDFVSYHFYPTGSQFAQSPNTWSKLYNTVQSAQGMLGTYLAVAAAVRTGSQPNAASTPIYITEYNDGSAFLADCCRNDPVFGSLWNSVFLADVLNSAYANQQLPRHVYYYAGSSTPYFCLLGKWNSAMDCDTSASTPYPQYYTYQLFASPQFLGLANGGHMAASVSTAGSNALLSTAFYAESSDVVVIINPTATAYAAVSVTAKKTGFSAPQASSFLLDSSHSHISQQAIDASSNGGETVSVPVPAYSTVAVRWTNGQAQESAPVAMLSVTPSSGVLPLQVTADSSASYDPDGSIVSRTLDFGDGTPAVSAAVATHTYNHAGSYALSVTVINNSGLSSTKTVHVTTSASADFSITATADGAQGTALRYILTVTPAGTLPSPVSLFCSQVSQGKECSFSTTSLSVGSHAAQAVLSITPTTSASETSGPRTLGFGILTCLFGQAFILLAPGCAPGRRKRVRQWLGGCLALCLLFLGLACGGAVPQAGTTPANNSAIAVVQASSGNQSHILTINLHQ